MVKIVNQILIIIFTPTTTHGSFLSMFPVISFVLIMAENILESLLENPVD